MQAALVHEVAADLDVGAVFKVDDLRQQHRGMAAGLQIATNGLQDAKLIVSGGESEVVTLDTKFTAKLRETLESDGSGMVQVGPRWVHYARC